MTQTNLTDIYRIFHPNIKEYTYFSAPHGPISKIDYILSNKTNLNKYKKIWNKPMYLTRLPWVKTRIQQQYKFQKALKHMEIKQCSPELSMNEGRNKGRN